jgi:uncharacterized repeat protein (TIGR02543 family)
MRRATSFLLALFLSVGLCVPAQAANREADYALSVQANGRTNATVAVGDSVEVTLVLTSADSNNIPLYSMSNWIIFDHNYLELTETNAQNIQFNEDSRASGGAGILSDTKLDKYNAVSTIVLDYNGEPKLIGSGTTMVTFTLKALKNTPDGEPTEIYNRESPTGNNMYHGDEKYDVDLISAYVTIGSTTAPDPVTYTVSFTTPGQTIEAITGKEAGEQVTLPTPNTREGYSFVGWSTDGTVKNIVSSPYTVTGDTALIAVWNSTTSGNPFSVTYNYNNGTGNTSTISVTSGSTIKLETPDRDGYTFAGWTVAQAGGEDKTYNGGDTYEVSGDVIFTANWTANTTTGSSRPSSGSSSNSSTTTTTQPSDDASIAGSADRLEALNNAASCDLSAESCPAYPYTDLDISQWYHTGIHYCLEMGRMVGVDENVFAPNQTLSRAMLVSILYQMEEKPEVSGSSTFVDVADGTWYTDPVIWAAANGIVDGISDTEFAPNDVLTREQMALILYRYAQHKHYDDTVNGDLSGFEDASSISNWAVEAVQWAVGHGLLTGRTTTTIVPQGSTTRAEAATIIYSFDLHIA